MQKEVLLACARRSMASFFIAVAVALVLYALVGPPRAGADASCGAINHVVLFIGIVLVSPLVETLVLAMLYLLSRLIFGSVASAWLAGSILAALHALVWWGWAVIVLVPCLLFAAPFAASSGSIERGFMRSFITHSLHNAYVFLVMLVATWSGC